MAKKTQACKLKPDHQFFFFVQLYLNWLRNLSDHDQKIVRFIFDLDEKERDSLKAALMIFEDYKKGKFNEKIISGPIDSNIRINSARSRAPGKKTKQVSMSEKRRKLVENNQDGASGQTALRQRKSKKRLERG